jgi:protein SCO1/2
VADLSIYQLEGDWTAADGDSAPLARLGGSPVLLLLFYGTCDYACPLLVHDLQRVEAMLDADTRARLRFALVSFDPERDTPERLAKYASDLKLDPARWRLLHGTPDQVRELAAALGVRYRPSGKGQFSHTMRIVLLDSSGVPVEHWDGLARPLEPIAQAAARAR